MCKTCKTWVSPDLDWHKMESRSQIDIKTIPITNTDKFTAYCLILSVADPGSGAFWPGIRNRFFRIPDL
jgi:hypothetical protein